MPLGLTKPIRQQRASATSPRSHASPMVKVSRYYNEARWDQWALVHAYSRPVEFVPYRKVLAFLGMAAGSTAVPIFASSRPASAYTQSSGRFLALRLRARLNSI